jgi:hypothetical protein
MRELPGGRPACDMRGLEGFMLRTVSTVLAALAACALAGGAMAQEAPASKTGPTSGEKTGTIRKLTEEELMKDLNDISESIAKGFANGSLAVLPRTPLTLEQRMALAIERQLVSRGCWERQAGAAGSPRLHAAFAVSFGPDGRFREPPKLIEPAPASDAATPDNDAPLQVFIQRAHTALETCNAAGFKLPQELADADPPLVLEVPFR